MLDKPTVLVVEDEFLVRLKAVEIVQDAGFVALEAQDADEAISILETHPEIRLVMTDINMPGSMTGLKMAMYAWGKWPPLKFIVVSGRPFPVEAEMPDGAHFHPKPYTPETITQSLAALL